MPSLSKGLVLHLPLDEESYNPATKRFMDKTPYSNHGTGVNAGVFTTDRMGQSNRATTFNGTSDEIDCGNDASLISGTEKTISFWMNTTSLSAHHMIIANAFNYTISGIRIGYLTAHFRAYWQDSVSGILYLSTNTNPSNTVWHHICFTLGSGAAKLYVDNVVQNDTKTYNGLVTDNSSTTVGAYAAQWYPGSAADVRIYNRALSDQERTLLYESYRPKLKISSLSKGLVLDLPLRNPYTGDVSVAGSEVLTDRTPYCNHGTNSGATIGDDYSTFNGSSDYVDCGLAPNLDITGDIAIAFWMKKTTAGAYYLICKGLGSAGGYYMYVDALGHIGYKTNQTGTVQVTSTDALFTDNDWYFVVITRSGTTAKIYRDNVECSYGTQEAHSDPANLSSYNFYVGQSNIDTARLNGSIAGVRIYNRIPSDQERTLLYESTKGRY